MPGEKCLQLMGVTGARMPLGLFQGASDELALARFKRQPPGAEWGAQPERFIGM
jgi:hypothetical protein